MGTNELRLPLKRKWFEMTKAGIKTEDYREINEYWTGRLFEVDKETEWDVWHELIEDLANPNRRHEDINECLSFFGVRFKKFDYNIMTLGYPKSNDTEKILKLEHKGIEIRTGNPEWGAEPNKLYFAIMHKTNFIGSVVWSWDEDVWDGKIDGTHYFTVEPTKQGATVYQMKKRVGNFIDMPSVEKAKEYCEVVLSKQLK